MSIDKKAFGLSDSLISAVSEALKGGQVKIDKNHNGKIDGQDFKMLRKEENIDEKSVSKAQQHAAGAALATQRGEYDGGKKGGAINRMASMKTSELRKFAGTKTKGLPTHKEEAVDEGNAANKAKKNAAAAAVGAKNRDGQYLSRMNPAVADKIRGREKMSGNDRKQFEEVEQVDELSKATLGSYIKKAATDVATNSAATGRHAERSNKIADHQKKTGDYSHDSQRRKDSKTADKAFDKSWKRRQGINKATDKLTKEEVVDEGKGPDAMTKARNPLVYGDKKKTNPLVYRDKHRDNPMVFGKKKVTKEEAEQVDELSTDTYHSAAHKAAKRAMGDAQGRSGPIFKKYAGMANKFRDKGMSQEKKEKAVKEAYDDNSSNVSDWSDKKLKWHKEKMSSSSAKAHSELVRRSKTGQAAPKKTNEETLDEIQGVYGNGGNKKNLKIIHKGVVVKDYGTDTKPNKASRDKKAEKMKAYRADRDKHMEEDIQIDEISKGTLASYGYKAGRQMQGNQPSDPDKFRKRINREKGSKLAYGKYYGHKVKVPATEETDPGFAEAAENPMAKQLADKKAAIQKTIAQKKMQAMQSKANKQISAMKEGKGCSCMEGKKSMTCEVHGDNSKDKFGKEKIELNPPLRD